MTFLLDSTLLISSLRGEASAITLMRKLLRGGHSLVTSAVNVGEVYSGVRPNELKTAEQLFEELDIYPVSFSIAKRAGELRNAAARKGRTLQLDDMMVAATALEFGFSIVTENIKDFTGVGVTLYGAGEN